MRRKRPATPATSTAGQRTVRCQAATLPGQMQNSVDYMLAANGETHNLPSDAREKGCLCQLPAQDDHGDRVSTLGRQTGRLHTELQSRVIIITCCLLQRRCSRPEPGRRNLNKTPECGHCTADDIGLATDDRNVALESI